MPPLPEKARPATLQHHLNLLRTEFEKAADSKKAEAMSAYMKNKFEFLGIPKPVRESIVKPWMKQLKDLSAAEQAKAATWLWKQKEREFQYVGMELLYKNKKHFTADTLPLLVKLVETKSWWDTVDFIAASLIGYYFEKFPENKKEKVREWSKSENMWLNRTAVIFQLKYKDKTNTDLLFHSMLPHLKSKEFFLQKAIGWALRQYAYTDPLCVKKFVASHELSTLSKREALKHF